MSSKTSASKKVTSSTTTTSRASASSKNSGTPTRSASQSKQTQSPLSPTKYSRVHEKAELANLNDRLACYIDRVRHLETENTRLTREVRTSEETITREVNTVKSIYERELGEARKLIDESARDKSKLEIQLNAIADNYDSVKKELDLTIGELQTCKHNLSNTESQLNDIAPKYHHVQQERNRLLAENKALEKAKNKLQSQLADAKKGLEVETLTRVELENQVQSLKEAAAFNDQLHQQHLTEIRNRKQVEISEIDGQLSTEYEQRLYQSLQEVREQYEIDLENNREEIKQLHEDKIRTLTSQLNRSAAAAASAIEEMKKLQLRVDEANAKLALAEQEKNNANQHARDYERQLEVSQANYLQEFEKYEKEMNKIGEQMAQQVKDYQDLMDVKVALDVEIAAYRKLLEGEETRLNITPVTSPSARPSLRASALRGKRKRNYYEQTEEISSSDYDVTTSSKGDIEVNEVCPEGTFVKLVNKGSKPVSLSGWQLTRKTEKGNNAYKFHRSIKVEPGVIITIWSSDTDHEHEPPLNILMKDQKWFVADSMTTSLLNSDGNEVATATHKKQQRSTSFKRQRDSGFFPQRLSRTYGEAAETNGSSEKCHIM